MQEGSSIVILKEEVAQFSGKVILLVSGNSKIDQSQLHHKAVQGYVYFNNTASPAGIVNALTLNEMRGI